MRFLLFFFFFKGNFIRTQQHKKQQHTSHQAQQGRAKALGRSHTQPPGKQQGTHIAPKQQKQVENNAPTQPQTTRTEEKTEDAQPPHPDPKRTT